jgi:hypothetical protein
MTSTTTHSPAEAKLLAEIERLRSLAEGHVANFQARLDAGDADNIGKSDYGKGLLKATVMAYEDMAEKMAEALAVHARVAAIYAPDGDDQ